MALASQLELARSERDDFHRELSDARQSIRTLQTRDAQLSERTDSAVKAAAAAEAASASAARDLALLQRLSLHLTTVGFVKMTRAKRALVGLMAALYTKTEALLAEVTSDPAPAELTSHLLVHVATRAAASPALPDAYELLRSEMRRPGQLVEWEDGNASGSRSGTAAGRRSRLLQQRGHAAAASRGDAAGNGGGNSAAASAAGSAAGSSGTGAGGSPAALAAAQFKYRLSTVPLDALLRTVSSLEEALSEAVGATLVQKRHWYRATQSFSQRSVELAAGTARSALLLQQLQETGARKPGALPGGPGTAVAAAAAAEAQLLQQQQQLQQQQASQAAAAADARARDQAALHALEDRLEQKRLQTQALQRQCRVSQDMLAASAARAADLSAYVEQLQRTYVRGVSALGGPAALTDYPLPPPPLTPVVDATLMGASARRAAAASAAGEDPYERSGAAPATLPPLRPGALGISQQLPPAAHYAGGAPDLYAGVAASQRGDPWRSPRELTLQRQRAGDFSVTGAGAGGPGGEQARKVLQVERDYGDLPPAAHAHTGQVQQQLHQQQQQQAQGTGQARGRVRLPVKGQSQGQQGPSAARTAHLARLGTFLAAQEKTLFKK
jgi:hypothetical protein